jgi:hypothetical protein
VSTGLGALQLGSTTFTCTMQVKMSCELGCNISVQLRACRYVYMACAVRPTNIGNGLAKMDLQTGAVKTWHMPGAVTGGYHHRGGWRLKLASPRRQLRDAHAQPSMQVEAVCSLP